MTPYPSYELLISEFVKHVFKDSEITSPARVAHFVIIVNVVTAGVVVCSCLGDCRTFGAWPVGGWPRQTHLGGSWALASTSTPGPSPHNI